MDSNRPLFDRRRSTDGGLAMRLTTRLTLIVLIVIGLEPARAPAASLPPPATPSPALPPAGTVVVNRTVPAMVTPMITRHFLMWYAVVGPGSSHHGTTFFNMLGRYENRSGW